MPGYFFVNKLKKFVILVYVFQRADIKQLNKLDGVKIDEKQDCYLFNSRILI